MIAEAGNGQLILNESHVKRSGPPKAERASENQAAAYGSSLDIIHLPCNLIMQSPNLHL